MEDYEISEVAKVINEWNPLGGGAERLNDLDGYRLGHLNTSSGTLYFNHN